MRFPATAWTSASVLTWMRTRVAAAGGNPLDIPDEPSSFWRLREVERRVGLSRPTIYRLAAAGRFPKPIPLSGARSAERSPGAAA